MNIYVPSNATETSPIILQVSNSGWMPSKVPDTTIANGTNYSSTTSQHGRGVQGGLRHRERRHPQPHPA